MKHELVEATTVIQGLLTTIDANLGDSLEIVGQESIDKAKACMSRYYSDKRTDKTEALLDEYSGYVDDAVDISKLMILQMMKDGVTDHTVLRNALDALCCRIVAHVSSEALEELNASTS